MSLSATSVNRRGKDGKGSNSSVAMDMESIRARRAKLEQILSTMRPPPLTKGGATSSSHPSLQHPTWPRRRHQPASNPTTALSDQLSSNPPIPKATGMNPYAQPLPGISRRREVSSLPSSPTGSRQTSGKRRTVNTDNSTNNTEKRPATGKKEPVKTESEAEGGNGSASESECEDASEETIREIVKGIGSNSSSKRLQNTIRARELLSKGNTKAIPAFMKAGILPKLMPHVQQENDPTLQLEAAWAVTNIASGTTEQTRAVVDAGAIPLLIKQLKSKTLSVKEQAAWALGNIAGDGEQLGNMVVRAGIIPPLLEALSPRKLESRDTAPVSLVQVFAWVLTNLFRFKCHAIGPGERRDCLSVIKRLLQYDNDDVIVDTLWTVSFIADTNDDCLEDVVVSEGLLPLLVTHLASGQKKRVVPALRATGNLVVGDDRQTDAVMAEGVVPLYGQLLKPSNDKAIRRDAAWSLSNITAGTKAQIQAVINEGILPDLIQAVTTEDSVELQREAAWALGNLTAGGSNEQVGSLVEAGAVASLTKVLGVAETSTITVALNALNEMFKHPELGERAREEFRDEEGVDQLEVLQEHVNSSVSEKAQEMLSAHFDDTRLGSHSDDDEGGGYMSV